MKQTLAMLFVTALLLFSLAGCGEKKDSNTANGPSTGTTDNGAADSNKKDDNASGDDMSGENKKDDSVTGDGMMGDDMDGDGERIRHAASTAAMPPRAPATAAAILAATRPSRTKTATSTARPI